MSYLAGRAPLVIAVTVTDRPDCLERLLHSLVPLETDDDLHVFVLDNGSSAGQQTRDLLSSSDHRTAGHRVVVRSQTPCSPLHRSRTELSRRAAEFASSLGTPPIVWMVDDDLSFEELRLEDGVLRVINVAEKRVAAVRRVRAHPRCPDMLVSGFTGDPPVPPSGVFVSQLRDLALELEKLARLRPSSAFPFDPIPPMANEYYYDYAERDVSSPADLRFPWIRRSRAGGTVGAQTPILLHEAAAIPSGSTPMRPLLTRSEATCEFRHVERSNRGGNAVFFGVEPLLAHSYPSFSISAGWSRRADMIGTTLLARSGRFALAESDLTLRHNRLGQPSFVGDVAQWLPEFAGVLFARLVMKPPMHGIPVESALRDLARLRAEIVVTSLKRTMMAAQRARNAIANRRAFWWRHDLSGTPATTLRRELERLCEELGRVSPEALENALREEELLETVLAAYRDVLREKAA